jgi:hypothetical protein
VDISSDICYHSCFDTICVTSIWQQ